MKLTKGRAIIIAGSSVVLISLAVGSLLWFNQDDGQQLHNGKQTVGDHTISLSEIEPEPHTSGLQVSGQADSLGQLGGNNKSGQGNGSSSGKADTASFAQYDKYRESPNALFGEIQQGTGVALAVGQKANIYYKVWLTNGALVDQSPVAANGQRQPFSFTLGAHQVIPGMEQGVAGMKVSGKRLIIVPPAVGYGAQGQGNIPPNAVLVFEVELTSAQ